ncbi:hypothetical protein Tco_1089028 [Tanacetum coccineum]
MPNANTVKDFRPISLIGSLYKIIAKILSNRLVVVLGDIVNEVQSAFIKDRQILDGPFILNEVLQWCLFKGIKLNSSTTISHMFYADDVVFVGQWCEGNITTLTHVLECFYRASGLRINMAKSKIMGTLVAKDTVNNAAVKLGCLILNTPFTYLGTKVGSSMTRYDAWEEVINKVCSRLSKWKMKCLSIGGRLTLIKSVLTAIPIFHLSIYKAPLAVLRKLESIRCHFFHGHVHNSTQACWIKWSKILAPKDKGGLGVSSLYALNRSLMLKWVWRFFDQSSSFWARIIKAIHGVDGQIGKHITVCNNSSWLHIVKEMGVLNHLGINFLDLMRLKLGDGSKTYFWRDRWIGDDSLKNLYPRVYALENSEDVTVRSKLTDLRLEHSFRRDPRGGIEQAQFSSLSDLVSNVNLLPISDKWSWTLNGSGEFSVASIRREIDNIRLAVVSSKTQWIKSVPIKVNIIAWKVKLDALPTRLNISRRDLSLVGHSAFRGQFIRRLVCLATVLAALVKEVDIIKKTENQAKDNTEARNEKKTGCKIKAKSKNAKSSQY